MAHAITPADMKTLSTFTPGIWDARSVHEALTALAERTGAIAFDGKRWDWTDEGQRLRNPQEGSAFAGACFSENFRD